ncbi:MAG: class I adenylate cyclase [Gammaproteobacteria bacterium]|nr:MAG: class I adenylate cyclase [Gammaproteobacteria bacterium]
MEARPQASGDEFDIDGVRLREIVRRYHLINRDRLQRVFLGIRDRQRIFLDVLPLLFHINHPLLPGYYSSKVPYGISGYRPDDRAVKAARRLSRSFRLARPLVQREDITALYLMGSSGTIAYSSHSDFDIWVCVRSGLSPHERELLARKTAGIESWAAGFGLEVHFFLMNDEAFRRGELPRLSEESSGSSQYHLLLDEFYRTSLLLAGRMPIWWLVPAEHEKRHDEYVTRLVSRRFVKPEEFVDFGGLGRMSPGEFFGAAVWQLYKAVSSPYKAVLKILLMESYAAEYPELRMLSVRMKEAVQRREIDLDQMDPYIQMFRRVEEYLLTNGELERLELARRCFYFKVNERLSVTGGHRTLSWRRELMRELVESWGWTPGHLRMLDERPHWKVQRVLEERHALVEALRQSYEVLSDFARLHEGAPAIDPEELNLLGRRLYTAFERKAGKVDLVNPGISNDLGEERVSLHQVTTGAHGGWVLYRGHVRPGETAGERPLKRTHGLVEMLAWCHFNRIVHPSWTMVHLYPEDCTVSNWEMRSVIDVLQDVFPDGRLDEPHLEALARPAHVERNALFVNLGVDPMAKLTREGKQLVSSRTDALSYGGRWENLALTFEALLQTSWKEVLTYRYSGPAALLDCLCDYLAWTPIGAEARPRPMLAFSFSSTRGATIARRVEEVFDQVIEWFYGGGASAPEHARFVLQVAHDYYVLQPENGVPRHRRCAGLAALLEDLAQPQPVFSPLRVDRRSLADTPLPVLFEANRENVLQLFYRVRGDQAEIHVLDEKGSLFTQTVAYRDALTLLTQYGRFLEKVQYRINHYHECRPTCMIRELEYYRIRSRQEGRFELERQRVHPFGQRRDGFGVQVIGEVLDARHPVFTLYCDDQEFTTVEYGEGLYEAVARHVISRREGKQTYPIYITDIDLSRSLITHEGITELQSIHFLEYKKRIEERLNAALEHLKGAT